MAVMPRIQPLTQILNNPPGDGEQVYEFVDEIA